MTDNVISNVYGALIDCRENAAFQNVLLSDEVTLKKLAIYQRNWAKRGKGREAPFSKDDVIAFIETSSVGFRANGFLLLKDGVLVLNDNDKGNGFAKLDQLIANKLTVYRSAEVVSLADSVDFCLVGSGYRVTDFLMLLKQLRLALQGKKIKSIKPEQMLPPDEVSSISRMSYVASGIISGISLIGAFGAHLILIRKWKMLVTMWVVGFIPSFIGDCISASGYSRFGTPLIALGVSFYALFYLMTLCLLDRDADGRTMLWKVPPEIPWRPWRAERKAIITCSAYLIGIFVLWGFGHGLAVHIDESRHTIIVLTEKIRLTDEEMSWYDKALAGDAEAQYRIAKILDPGDGVSEARSERAFRWALKSAEQGNPNGENYVGCCYIYGWGVETNAELGVEWQFKAISHGSIKAKGNMANNYLNGRGVEKNYTLALKFAKDAADSGVDFAHYTLGRIYFNGWGVATNYIRAAQCFSAGAIQDHDASITMLAHCYEQGLGVPQDDNKAKDLFHKAAELGNPAAQERMVEICLSSEDFATALQWAERAMTKRKVEHGESAMQGLMEYYAGLCYKNGWGCKKDVKKAKTLLYKGKSLGNIKAYQTIAESFEDGSLGEKNPAEAFRMYQDLYAQNNQFATTKLGTCYWNGIGVLVDKERAVKYFEESANADYAEGQNLLAKTYLMGEGKQRDYGKAVHWFELAASQGCTDAIFCLGACHYNGHGVPVDFHKAFEFFNRAAKKGHAQAMACIGDMYRDGKGISKNKILARSWYKKALDKGWKAAEQALEDLDKTI